MNRLARIVVTTGAIVALSALSPVFGQSGDTTHPLSDHHMVMPLAGIPQGTPPAATPMTAHQMMQMTGEIPTLPGQDAFGALQEIVRILAADPHTDWSKVNLDALREHLIDMNEVTLHADADVQRIDGGIKIAVTGTARTLTAIQRLLTDQVRHLDGTQGWHVTARPRPDGLVLIVTADDPKQAIIIRGLGFAGVLASGDYHQMHHLAMAKGEFTHDMAR